MTHDIHARLSYLSISAQKVRLVVDLVRGKNAVQAMEILRFAPPKRGDSGWKTSGICRCQCRGELRCQP